MDPFSSCVFEDFGRVLTPVLVSFWYNVQFIASPFSVLRILSRFRIEIRSPSGRGRRSFLLPPFSLLSFSRKDFPSRYSPGPPRNRSYSMWIFASFLDLILATFESPKKRKSTQKRSKCIPKSIPKLNEKIEINRKSWKYNKKARCRNLRNNVPVWGAVHF